ncbi:MAG: YraN family protein [Puniceicoccales bacterium]|jgi:putative endonuclease|nr:YraN family protein [Puniceicoccales bacterium]
MRNQDRGQWGEGVATRFLQEKCYDVLARNWRCGHDEVDIIANDAGVLVFVEVKTRSSADMIGGYGAARTSRKKQALCRARDAFLQTHAVDAQTYRLDVIEVLTPKYINRADRIVHFENIGFS